MKKFLVILMVVAMASFLFVGCLPGVTPDVDDEEEDEEVVVPTSATPVLTAVEESDETSIFTVTSTSTLYMNEDEAGSSILVKGTAPSESLVTIYIDDVAVVGAVGETAVTGLWTVAIAESSLGADGVKVMHATVTEVGLAESAASNTVTFTLDTVDPGFSIAATAAAAASGDTLDSAVSTSTSGDDPVSSITEDGDDNTDAVAGTWTIYILGDSTDASWMKNVQVTTPAGVTTTYAVSNVNIAQAFITGFDVTLVQGFIAGDGCDIVVTEAGVTAAILSRATITFDEDVTHAGMALGVYTTHGDPTTYKEATNTGYWEIDTGTADAAFTITAYGFTDLAGNAGGTSTSLVTATCTIGAASTTSLAP